MARSASTCLRWRGISSISTSSRASSSRELREASYSARPRLSCSRSASTNSLLANSGGVLGRERGDARTLPGGRRGDRHAAPGLNGAVEDRDRPLVVRGEPQDVVAVDDGLLPQGAEGFLVSGDRGKFDTQEGVQPVNHAPTKSIQYASRGRGDSRVARIWHGSCTLRSGASNDSPQARLSRYDRASRSRDGLQSVARHGREEVRVDDPDLGRNRQDHERDEAGRRDSESKTETKADTPSGTVASKRETIEGTVTVFTAGKKIEVLTGEKTTHAFNLDDKDVVYSVDPVVVGSRVTVVDETGGDKIRHVTVKLRA